MYDDELAISGLLFKGLVSSATVACENSRDYVNVRSYPPQYSSAWEGEENMHVRTKLNVGAIEKERTSGNTTDNFHLV